MVEWLKSTADLYRDLTLIRDWFFPLVILMAVGFIVLLILNVRNGVLLREIRRSKSDSPQTQINVFGGVSPPSPELAEGRAQPYSPPTAEPQIVIEDASDPWDRYPGAHLTAEPQSTIRIYDSSYAYRRR